MPVRIFDTLDDLPEPHPSGTYVIIDAYKFATTVCTLLSGGAESVTPLKSKAECQEFKSDNPNAYVGGEMTPDNKPPGEFTIGNSPTYVEDVDVQDRKIGLHSDNGAEAVRGLENADEVYLGSTVNAAALGIRLRELDADSLYLLTAGRDGETALEDVIVASLLHRYLTTSTLSSGEQRLYKELLSVAARGEWRPDPNPDFERLFQFNSSDVIPKLVDGAFVDSV